MPGVDPVVKWEQKPFRRERQIASSILEDITSNATALLSKTKTPVEDRHALQSMLNESQTIQKIWITRKENENGGEEVDDLAALLQQQFDLSDRTHDDANDLFHSFARIMAVYASLWISIGLGFSATMGFTKFHETQIEEAVNFFALRIEAFEQNRERTKPPERDRAKRDAGRLLHINLDEKFRNGFGRFTGGIAGGTALHTRDVPIIFVPFSQRVQLTDLLVIFRRDFKPPQRLKENAKFAETESGTPGRFDCVVNKIEAFEKAARSFGDQLSAVDYVFRNALKLVKLNQDLEDILRAPLGEKRKWLPKRPREILPAQKGVEESPTDEDPSDQGHQAPAIDESETISIRKVVAGSWVLRTRLDDFELDERLMNEQDKSTFKDPRQCAGYHIEKHAKGYLVETYLKEGLKLHKNHWAGVVSPRIARGGDAGSDEWVMLVRCAAGCGCFSHDGRQVKVIWYEPPAR